MGDIVLGGKRHSENNNLNKDNDHTGHLGYYIRPDRNVQTSYLYRDGNFWDNKGYSFGRDALNSNGYTSANNTQNRWKTNHGRDFITANAPIVHTGELIGIINRSAHYEGTELRNYCGLYSTTSLDSEDLNNGYGGFPERISSVKIVDGRRVGGQSRIRATAVGKGFNEKMGKTSPVDLFKSAGGGAMGSRTQTACETA